MNRRSFLIVAAIVVVALLLAVVGQRRSAPDGVAGSPLLPGLAESLDEIERIVVTKAGAESVATLVHDTHGWSVVEKDGYPADVAKIRRMLLAFAEARVIEEKTSNAAYYDRLGVESVAQPAASGTAVALDGDFPQLILGDEANSASRYVRRSDEERSYLVDRNPDVPRDTAQWLLPDILDVRGARVQSVTIAHADGERVVIDKTDAEQTNFAVADVPSGRELSYPGVANVIGNVLRELRLDDAARASAGSEPHVVTEFRSFDGLVVTVTGAMHDAQPWLTFAARAEVETGAEGNAAGESPAQDAAPTTDPAAEAAAINARVAGWRYRIPAHQYDQLTRRLADLLAPAA